ncbi:MAG TPA: Tad domain-containing protein [Acidimicrobiia bacterium]|nr:Tad domain-containing protein [Acidimicrobiia bacterium]
MKRHRREEGIALVWLAITLVLLIGMAGFGVDLGWIYLNTSRAQKAVDSAALAGVVNLPGFIAQAEIDAEDATQANGFDPDGLTVTPLADNKLHAELRIQVEPFFLSVLGFDHFNITREATAEYIKPVPLGNPNNCFGCPGVGDSWAAISSQFIHKEHGDPYSTQCRVPSSPSSCSSGNSDYNRGGAYAGYYYGIEVFGTSQDLTVELFDPRFNRRPQDEGTGDFAFSGSPGPITTYSLHMVDITPLNPIDNPAIPGCSMTLDPDTTPTFQDQWVTLCTLGGSLTPGIYVLHVTNTGTGIASNHYSVQANVASGTTPRVYGINDMSIWSNDLVQNSQLYIAEIEAIHAGKKLELQFYDPGDANANSFMTLLSPNGPVNCSWTVWNHNLTAQSQPPGSGACTWQTTNTSRPGDRRVYNEQWIVATIDLPDDPADMCNGSDCFWKMELDLSDPTERTTWRARVIGNPVRLIP